MGLFNVRLDPDDSRKAGALRKSGIPVSEVVRRAIREEYARRVEVAGTRRKPSEIVAQILALYPAPSHRTPVDTTDRRAVREFVRGRLKRGSR